MKHAWQAWLDFLKRLRESDEKRRVENEKNPNSWRVPYEGRGYNDDMKDWKG